MKKLQVHLLRIQEFEMDECEKNTMNMDKILTDNSAMWRRNIQKYQLKELGTRLAQLDVTCM